MTIVADSPHQYKNFVSAQRDIRLHTRLSEPQADAVAKLLLEAHPALNELRKVGQLQFINAAGQFRVVGVRGGYLPEGLTSEDVRCLVDTVKAETQGDEGRLAPLWADAERIHYGRRAR